MLLEVYKCIKKLNAPCLHNLFNTNTIPYQIRASKLEQPLRRTTRYGLRTLSYVGPYVCNSVLNDHSDIVQWIQGILKYMEGSGYFSICDTSPLMTVSGSSVGVCRVLGISIDILLQVYMYFLSYDCILYLAIALYIYAPYTCSRILAFWLMLFVLHKTQNSVYLILSYVFLLARLLLAPQTERGGGVCFRVVLLIFTRLYPLQMNLWNSVLPWDPVLHSMFKNLYSWREDSEPQWSWLLKTCMHHGMPISVDFILILDLRNLTHWEASHYSSLLARFRPIMPCQYV